MTTLEMFLLVITVFVSGVFSCMIGEILAHLVLYSRRGQAKKGRKRSDGINSAFINLIKHK
jgi:hypothetical protein